MVFILGLFCIMYSIPFIYCADGSPERRPVTLKDAVECGAACSSSSSSSSSSSKPSKERDHTNSIKIARYAQQAHKTIRDPKITFKEKYETIMQLLRNGTKHTAEKIYNEWNPDIKTLRDECADNHRKAYREHFYYPSTDFYAKMLSCSIDAHKDLQASIGFLEIEKEKDSESALKQAIDKMYELNECTQEYPRHYKYDNKTRSDIIESKKKLEFLLSILSEIVSYFPESKDTESHPASLDSKKVEHSITIRTADVIVHTTLETIRRDFQKSIDSITEYTRQHTMILNYMNAHHIRFFYGDISTVLDGRSDIESTTLETSTDTCCTIQ